MIKTVDILEIENLIPFAKKENLCFNTKTQYCAYFLDNRVVGFCGWMLFKYKAILKNDYVLSEYRIADNKTGEFAEWDISKLIPELFETDQAVMTKFFNAEELDKLLSESSGSDENFKFPTQKNLDIKQIDLNSNFKDKNKKEISEYINLSCPECGETFNVKRNDILTRTD